MNVNTYDTVLNTFPFVVTGTWCKLYLILTYSSEFIITTLSINVARISMYKLNNIESKNEMASFRSKAVYYLD